jgi:hypothetical protein
VLGACPKQEPGDETRGETTQVAGSSSGASTSSGGPPTTGASTGPGPTTGPDATSSTSGSSTSTGDPVASTGDASTGSETSTGGSTGDESTGAPPVLYDCYGCTCDVNVTYCRKVFAGANFAGPDGPSCPVVEEMGLESGCVAYPANCDPPSCDCIPTMEGGCYCTEIEKMVVEVVCPLP